MRRLLRQRCIVLCVTGHKVRLYIVHYTMQNYTTAMAYANQASAVSTEIALAVAVGVTLIQKHTGGYLGGY